MSRLLSTAGHLPTAAGFSAMKEDLAFKKGEMEKDKNTLDGLGREHGQLQMNLEKVSNNEHLTQSGSSHAKETSHLRDQTPIFRGNGTFICPAPALEFRSNFLITSVISITYFPSPREQSFFPPPSRDFKPVRGPTPAGSVSNLPPHRPTPPAIFGFKRWGLVKR